MVVNFGTLRRTTRGIILDLTLALAGLAWIGMGSVPVSAQAAEVPALNLVRGLPQVAKFKAAWNDLAGQLSSLAGASRPTGQFFQVAHTETDGLSTVRFQQSVDGIEVLGGQLLRHTRAQSESLQGLIGSEQVSSWTHHAGRFDLDTRPSLSAAEALDIARSEAPGQELSARPRLVILPDWSANAARLVYRIEIAGLGEVAGRVVTVDAHNGRILSSVSTHWEIAPVDAYQTNQRCQVLSPVADGLGGRAPISVDYKKCTKVISAGVPKPQADAEATQAFANSQTVLKYFWDVHQRDSFDGKGATVVNIVHIGDKWSNAFWNSEEDIMAYGDGDGKVFRNLTLSLDVAGHEMTHGVVSKTADLEYQGESGALNEGFADFFGETIEGQKDWVMGRELFLDPAQGKNGIRNLQDPHLTTFKWKDEDGNPIRRPAPAKYSEIFTFEGETCGRSNDNCGVHMNATLIGHAGYLLVKAMGRDKAEKLFYATLVHHLTATSDFAAFGKGMRKACGNLLGSVDCQALEGVLTQVGL